MPNYRTPTALKRLHGNPGKRALNNREPAFTGRPICPRWLDPLAKLEWRRVMRELTGLDLLKSVDQTVLAAYCQSYARWKQAERLVSHDGQILSEPVMTRSGHFTGRYRQRAHPAVLIAKHEKADCAALGRCFGFDPASRTRVHVNTDAEVKPTSLDDTDADIFGPIQ